MVEVIFEISLTAILCLILFSIVNFLPLIIFFICEILIKGVILIKLNNKYEERFTNKQILFLYFEDILKYKILLQVFINLISMYYTAILVHYNIDNKYPFLVIIFDVLMLIFSYKIIYKEYKKVFNVNKLCVWYSLLVMPDIFATLIYNGFLAICGSDFFIGMLSV